MEESINYLQYNLNEKRKIEFEQRNKLEKKSAGGRNTHIYTTINELGGKYCKTLYNSL